MQPDFYTGSSHKWPCGPLEVGVLYIDRRVQSRLWPSIYSAYPGETGVSRTFEGMGQRDEPAIRAFADSLRFLRQIGQPKIEACSRELGRAAIEALQRIDGVIVWTSADPARAAAVVAFKPGDLNPAAVVAALERDGVVAAVPPSRPGRPCVRFSPHFYNSHADVEKAVAAIHGYLRRGL
jgi:selenocysteine lyase/cysteine desulfurase